jgi:hypothetical protein
MCYVYHFCHIALRGGVKFNLFIDYLSFAIGQAGGRAGRHQHLDMFF